MPLLLRYHRHVHIEDLTRVESTLFGAEDVSLP
jgi:hypothetical protein